MIFMLMLFLCCSEEFVLQAAENGDNTKLKELHEAGTAFAITNSVSTICDCVRFIDY